MYHNYLMEAVDGTVSWAAQVASGVPVPAGAQAMRVDSEEQRQQLGEAARALRGLTSQLAEVGDMGGPGRGGGP